MHFSLLDRLTFLGLLVIVAITLISCSVVYLLVPYQQDMSLQTDDGEAIQLININTTGLSSPTFNDSPNYDSTIKVAQSYDMGIQLSNNRTESVVIKIIITSNVTMTVDEIFLDFYNQATGNWIPVTLTQINNNTVSGIIDYEGFSLNQAKIIPVLITFHKIGDMQTDIELLDVKLID